MNTHPLTLHYSRSAVTTDWKCPRQRWWQYEASGRGIVTDATQLELFLGTVTHDGLAAIAHEVDIDSIACQAVAQVKEMLLANAVGEKDADYFACEQAALVEGMLRGFHRHTWPILMKQYPTVVKIEEEMVYEHAGPHGEKLVFMAKPDLILRDAAGDCHYLEYKTTSSTKDQWINSWSTAVQLHSSIRAVEATIGEKIATVIVQGLAKGYVSYEKQNSPWCYMYHKSAQPPFTKDVWSYDYKPGLKKYPTWLREGGVKKVVEEMPVDMLAMQFPQVPPIMINDHLIDAFFRQRAVREVAIKEAATLINSASTSTKAKQELLDTHFGQAWEVCNPGWGRGCAYRRICHGAVDDPLTNGFLLRVSHHTPERELHER